MLNASLGAALDVASGALSIALDALSIALRSGPSTFYAVFKS